MKKKKQMVECSACLVEFEGTDADDFCPECATFFKGYDEGKEDGRCDAIKELLIRVSVPDRVVEAIEVFCVPDSQGAERGLVKNPTTGWRWEVKK